MPPIMWLLKWLFSNRKLIWLFPTLNVLCCCLSLEPNCLGFCHFLSLWPQWNYLHSSISFCGDRECVPFRSLIALGLRWTDGPGCFTLKYRRTFTLRPRFPQAPLRRDWGQKGYWSRYISGVHNIPLKVLSGLKTSHWLCGTSSDSLQC